MAGEFRGVVYSPQYVDSTAGSNVPVTMPADILAGDILVVSGGGYNLHTFDQPAGWSGSLNSCYVKIADGSEAGATINFISHDTTTLDPFGTSPNPRATVIAAFCYRFPVPYITGGGIGPSSAFHTLAATPKFVPPGGSTDCFSTLSFSTYYGNVGVDALVNGVNYQFRWLTVAAQGNAGAVASSIAWTGDLLTDRTGIQSEAWSGDPNSYVDGVSTSFADQMYLSQALNNDPSVDITVTAPACTGFYCDGFALFFAAPPTTAPYWGILITPG